ncbi:MAG: MW1434 family type I TA system toxin [Eubacteriaceae bacterium]|nr:MW1434 family type I TA system toxin [Eubacteriaceae bacterium]
MKEYNKSFGEAIEAAKQGKRIARSGWNGKDQYVEIGTGFSYVTAKGKGEKYFFRVKNTNKGASISYLSNLPHEKEVAISKSARYTVVSKKMHKGIYYVDLEEQP